MWKEERDAANVRKGKGDERWKMKTVMEGFWCV